MKIPSNSIDLNTWRGACVFVGLRSTFFLAIIVGVIFFAYNMGSR